MSFPLLESLIGFRDRHAAGPGINLYVRLGEGRSGVASGAVPGNQNIRLEFEEFLGGLRAGPVSDSVNFTVIKTRVFILFFIKNKNKLGSSEPCGPSSIRNLFPLQ